MTRIQVCGVRSREDALMCVEEGVDAVGFVNIPGRSRSLPLGDIREIISTLGTGVEPVLIVKDPCAESCGFKAMLVGAGTIQAYGSSIPDIRLLKEGGFRVIRPVGVDPVSGVPLEGVEQVCRLSEAADMVLLEPVSGSRMGGSGIGFDEPERLRELVGSLPEFAIAGGLDPGNVERVLPLSPSLVDVSTGVEREAGHKDRSAVREFVGRCGR